MNDDKITAFAIGVWGVCVLAVMAFWSFVGWLIFTLVEWLTSK